MNVHVRYKVLIAATVKTVSSEIWQCVFSWWVPTIFSVEEKYTNHAGLRFCHNISSSLPHYMNLLKPSGNFTYDQV
jgi:hypothetical protein